MLLPEKTMKFYQFPRQPIQKRLPPTKKHSLLIPCIGRTTALAVPPILLPRGAISPKLPKRKASRGNVRHTSRLLWQAPLPVQLAAPKCSSRGLFLCGSHPPTLAGSELPRYFSCSSPLNRYSINHFSAFVKEFLKIYFKAPRLGAKSP